MEKPGFMKIRRHGPLCMFWEVELGNVRLPHCNHWFFPDWPYLRPGEAPVVRRALGRLRERRMPRVLVQSSLGLIMVWAAGGFWETWCLSHSECSAKCSSFTVTSEDDTVFDLGMFRLDSSWESQEDIVSYTFKSFFLISPLTSNCYCVLMTGESPFLTKPFGEVSIWFFDWTFPAPRSFQIHPNGIQMWRFLKKNFLGESASCFITKACVGLLDWSDSPALSPKELVETTGRDRQAQWRQEWGLVSGLWSSQASVLPLSYNIAHCCQDFTIPRTGDMAQPLRVLAFQRTCLWFPDSNKTLLKADNAQTC